MQYSRELEFRRAVPNFGLGRQGYGDIEESKSASENDEYLRQENCCESSKDAVQL